MATDDRDGERCLLRLHAVTLFVRDRGRSARFFVDALGFALLSGGGGAGEPAWSAVAPPDGTALLSLVEDPQAAAGPAPSIVLLTDDVQARCDDWTRRGVRFRQPPVIGARLAAALRDATGPAAAIAERIIADVLAFGGADLYDDLTLVVAVGA